MIRGLIIVKAAHVAQARTLAQQPPFSVAPETVENFLVPANPVRDDFGVVTSPATLFWASGLFESDFWTAVVQAAAAFEWGGAWEYDPETDPTFPQTKVAEVAALETFSLATP